jgi:DNA mismatch repair ATPase MutL
MVWEWVLPMRDCVLSAMRHQKTTSDLFSLHTKGFRGEAPLLRSHVEMKTNKTRKS